jgi:serine/threonine protein kinase
MEESDETINDGDKVWKVKKHLYIDGQTFRVVEQMGSNGRVRYLAFQKFGKKYPEKRVIHVLPNDRENEKVIENLKRTIGSSFLGSQIVLFEERADRLFLVLNWIPGQSLRSYLNEIRRGSRPPFSPYEAIRLNSQLIHQVVTLSGKLGVFHGDVSPDNIIISPNNHRLNLIDFGSSFRFSEINHHDEGDGKREAYRAPEQYRGEAANLFSEQFSCGMVVYEMLTGRIAYEESGGTIERESRPGATINLELPSAILKARKKELPKSVWRLLDDYVASTLALKPEDRYATNQSWLAAVKELKRQSEYDPPEKPPNILLVRILEFWDRIRRNKSSS